MEERKNLIMEQLNDLTADELEEVHYFLSTYKNLSAAEAKGNVAMHFFGRLAGLRQLDNNQVEMNLGIHNLNTYGVAQGGAIYTLADVSIGFMLINQVETGKKVLTLELKVNFIRKGEGKRLIATPTVLSMSRKTAVAECAVEDEEGNLVAKALGTFYLA